VFLPPKSWLALQDLDRAVVVGSRSFGKGLVQRPVGLTQAQLKFRYYTPSGRCIQALDYSKRQNGKAIKPKRKTLTPLKPEKEERYMMVAEFNQTLN
jgi:carboxyl-terminal processing protease